ncbi:hypothetical protein KM043_004827 [Ampulex compressa]|nr:hypothetical protein KM043_004827 [Ampulex compressa]
MSRSEVGRAGQDVAARTRHVRGGGRASWGEAERVRANFAGRPSGALIYNSREEPAGPPEAYFGQTFASRGPVLPRSLDRFTGQDISGRSASSNRE